MLKFRSINPVRSAQANSLTFLFFLLPATLWLVIFFFLPLLLVLVDSFLTPDISGSNWHFSLEQYQRIGDPLYLGIFWRSIWLGFLATIACLVIGYPLAFSIVLQPQRWRSALLLLIIIPFWTNFLVRIYAWIGILQREGLINSVLTTLKIVEQPLDLLFTPLAVAIGLIYGYLPFMVLPIYSSLEQFDFTLVEAAQDLGANAINTFWRVVFPLTLRGIISGGSNDYVRSFRGDVSRLFITSR
jgi:spermidine/putrescine transport system permease protein